ATASFAQHRVAADGALQCRFARRWPGGAEPDGALLPPALRCPAGDALGPVLWGKPPLGALVPGSGAAGPAFRPAEHHGLYPPALQRPAGPDRLRTDLSYRCDGVARAPDALADGCADPPG